MRSTASPRSSRPKLPLCAKRYNAWGRLLRQWLFAACLFFPIFLTQADDPAVPPPNDDLIPKKVVKDSEQVIQADAYAKKIQSKNSNFSPYEKTRRFDYLKLEQWEAQAAENRERSRKRIVLPRDALAAQDPSDLPATYHSHESTAPVSAIDAPLYHGVKQSLFLIAFVCIGGFFCARELAPQFHEWLKNNLNPWSIAPAFDLETSPIPLAEEKAFAEFQAKFRVNSPTPAKMAASAPLERAPMAEDVFERANAHINRLQKLINEINDKTNESVQRKLLRTAYEKIHPLKALTASEPELSHLEKMTFALELLIKQLTEQSGTITSSTLRTVTQGIETLAELGRKDLDLSRLGMADLRFLVVDDEMFSRYALSLALKRTLNEPEVAENVEAALQLAEKNTYDLIFLDIGMPDMDGFELCAKIRETKTNQHTPVVFVTFLRDFDTRAKSIICGARDLISKPFLTFELIVKTLTLVTHERLKDPTQVEFSQLPAIENKPATKEALKPLTAVPAETNIASHGEIVKEPMSVQPDSSLLSKATLAFFTHAKSQVQEMQSALKIIRTNANQKVTKETLNDLYLLVHSFAVGAAACQAHSVSQLGHGLEALLKKLLPKSEAPGFSTQQTIGDAIELLEQLCAEGPANGKAINKPIGVLAADDDPIARRFMANALQLNFLAPQSAEDGATAVKMAREHSFDVIFLDVQMPGLDGFDACKQIREVGVNMQTPVVFITSHHHPKLETQVAACKGNEFLSKPYICSELTLKTITLALRHRRTLQFAAANTNEEVLAA